jgi:TonB-linked SusC/RagA family outer membrane protein
MEKKKFYKLFIKATKITFVQLVLAVSFMSTTYAFEKTAHMDLNQKSYLQVQDAGDPLSTVFDNLLQPRQLQYKLVDKVIILKKIENSLTSTTPLDPPSEIEKSETIPLLFVVTGQITDEKGEPLVGASVVLEGTSKGALTDEKGSFRLDLNDSEKNGKLIVSYVGYEKQVITIEGRNSIDVILAETAALEEVVVVGYGTKKKANLTGAVSNIDASAIENRPVENATLALQGLSPGLTVTRVSGKPGTDDIGIQIRGATTANGSVEPLIVLDGVNVPGNTLTTMNPNDIESISVLKDAAAASIYGAQAAGGVILITSKKAKAGKVKFSYLAQRSADWSINEPDRLTLLEEAEFANLSQKNAGSGAEYSAADLQRIRDNIPYIVNPADTTTWLFYNQEPLTDQVLKKFTATTTHNLSVSGGTEKLNFLLSGGYYHKDGLFKVGPDDYSRYNLRLNVGSQLSNRLSLDTRLAYTNDRSEQASGTINGGGLIYELYRLRTRTPFFTPDGQYSGAGSAATAYARLEAGGYNRYRRNFFDVTSTAQYKFSKDIRFRAIVGNQMRLGNRANFARTVPLWGRGRVLRYLNQVNSYTLTDETTNNLNLQFLFDYTKTFAKKHNVALFVGYQWEDFRFENVVTGASNLVSNDLPTLNLGDDKTKTNSQDIRTYAVQSIPARLSYDYDGIYIVEGSLRYDESSRLAPNARQKFFPAVTAGWNIHREKFFSRNMKDIVSQFKLRGSWGRLGGALGTIIGNYDYLGQLSRGSALVLGDSRSSYLFQNSIPSADLSWETIQTTNGGVDLGFFKNKLQISADYYVKKNRNMLTPQNLPAVIGIGTPRKNNGELKSWGWELEAKYRGKIGKSFNYTIGGNLFDNQNLLTNFAGRKVVTEGTNGIVEGYPINSIFGFKTAGYFSNADEVKSWAFQDTRTGVGDVKYLDLNGDGRITIGDGNTANTGDLVYLGTTQPRFTFGGTLTMNWKGIDFTAFVQGVGKRTFRPEQQTIAPLLATFKQALAIHRNYWTPENPNAFYPRPYTGGTHNYRVADKWLLDGQYARLKNIQIGYTFPDKLMKKARISRLRVFFSGQDLLTFSNLTHFKGYFDPEQRDNVEADYPFFSTASAGLNLNF